MNRWTVATAALGAVFFGLSLSTEVYVATSPPALWGHVLLRKIYSIVAFGLVAYCLRRALEANGRRYPAAFATCVVALALYSAAIEVAQAIVGSQEGLVWNAIDVVCGAIGGALGAVVARRRVA